MIKRYCSIITALLCAFALSVPQFLYAEVGEETAQKGRTVHVRADGEGDGSSADSPMNDIAEAFETLAESGGEIVVWGKYELASSSGQDDIWGAFVEPEHEGKITVRGEDAFLVCPENYRYYMSGPTEMTDIGISGSGALLVAARFNPLIMGEGINIIGFSDGVYLIGGFNGSNSGMSDAALARDSYIEVRSGSYKYICGYNRATANRKCTGRAYVEVHGGVVNCIGAGISGGNAAFTGNAMSSLDITVSGGEIYKVCDTDNAAYGALGELSLDYSGGIIENVIMSDKVASHISFTEEMTADVSGLLRFFDTCSTGEGEAVPTRRIRIACVGDSITGGQGTSDPDSESYPAQLGEMLGDKYEVANFSEGGRTVLSGTGSAFIESEALRLSLEYRPDAVLIMLGSADLSVLRSMEDAESVLYESMLSLVMKYTGLESKPVVYLLTPTQRTDDSTLDRTIRDIVCPVYSRLAEDAGLGYVDMYTVSKDVRHHFPDSVHPDAEACSYIATWMYSAVVSNGSISSIRGSSGHVEIIIGKPPVQTPPDTEEQTTTAPATEPHTQPPSRTHDTSSVIIAIGVIVAASMLCCTWIYTHRRAERTGKDRETKE